MQKEHIKGQGIKDSTWLLGACEIRATDFCCVFFFKKDVHVFAMEKNATDKKRFYLVTTYIELWFYYK